MLGPVHSPKEDVVVDSKSDTTHKETVVIDIRSYTSQSHHKLEGEEENQLLKNKIINGLQSTPAFMPTYILYDTRGLQLFNTITHLKSYYLTECEANILKRHAIDLANAIQRDSIIIELGCGSLLKTQLILYELERIKKPVTYYALDLSEIELKKAIQGLDQGLKYVKVVGLLGTYDDGRVWLAESRKTISRQVTLLWLGSSIGNLTHSESTSFIRKFADETLLLNDAFVIGFDGRNDPHMIYNAYNEKEGITREFILNGLRHIDSIFGGKQEIFRPGDWDYEGRYHVEEGYHEANYIATKGTVVKFDNAHKFHYSKGDRIKIEQSWKYNLEQISIILDASGLTPIQTWKDDSGRCSLYVAFKPAFHFPLVNNNIMGVPGITEWSNLWKAWDLVSETMLTNSMLLEQPIDVRNEFIFYRGHIPTFLDMKLVEATPEIFKNIEPKEYIDIFGRGIDPDLDDPSQVHWHSKRPNDWPRSNDIKLYKDKVRQRVEHIYKSLTRAKKILWNAVCLGYEHEAMHLETLLYMLVQSKNTNPPTTSSWSIHQQLYSSASTLQPDTVIIEARESIRLGYDFSTESNSDEMLIADYKFGWDNESPARMVPGHGKIEVARQLITNKDYLAYLNALGITSCDHPLFPASWEGSVAGPKVKTVFGKVEFSENDVEGPATWPLTTSYDHFQQYALWKGNDWRLPSEPELVSIYESANGLASDNGYNIPVSNTGFKHWHPNPLHPEIKLSGVGGTGVFEWTATVMNEHEGFVKERLYPEYSSDFFDGKHNVVLGGSWATLPRLAGRRSFRNWYQRAYKFAFIGARLVRDVRSDD
ncbi:histidine-specific methyltransferase [Dipodascopsis uninucleata]